MNQMCINNKGQATFMEYALVLSVVIGFIVGMSVFFQRGFQAQMRDVSVYMINEVSEAHGEEIALQYEPYYGNFIQTSTTKSVIETRLLEGGVTGVFSKDIDETNYSDATDIQLPPKESDD